MTSSRLRPAGPGRIRRSGRPPPAESAVTRAHSLSGREESTREGEASSIWRPHPGRTQQPPPAGCFKGADPSRGLFCIRRWTAAKSHKPSTARADKSAARRRALEDVARGDPFPTPGAFHHASARPSGSTLNPRSHPAPARGGGLCSMLPAAWPYRENQSTRPTRRIILPERPAPSASTRDGTRSFCVHRKGVHGADIPQIQIRNTMGRPPPGLPPRLPPIRGLPVYRPQ